MRKRTCLLIVGIFTILICGSFSNVATLEAKEIVLKAVTAWPANDRMSTAPFFMFQAMANKQLKEKLRIEYLGGPEVIPSFDLIEAVKNGVIDIASLSGAYYQRVLPEAGVLNLSKLNHREMRQSGFYDAFNQIHQKKVNVFYYAHTNGEGIKYAIYLKKKIEKPDFTGLKLRGSPFYVPLIKALGAAPVVLPPPEIYTALERGVIDGLGWPNMGITDWGWQEVVKYMVDHEFCMADQVLLINLDTWNKLPEPLRKEMADMAPILEDNAAKFNIDLRLQYRKLYQASGIEFIKYSPADAEKFLNTVYEATKEDFLKKGLDDGPKLLKLLTK